MITLWDPYMFDVGFSKIPYVFPPRLSHFFPLVISVIVLKSIWGEVWRDEWGWATCEPSSGFQLRV